MWSKDESKTTLLFIQCVDFPKLEARYLVKTSIWVSPYLWYNSRRTAIIQILRNASPFWLRQPGNRLLMRHYTISLPLYGKTWLKE